MPKYRVAVEHINTHKIWLFDVEADDMGDAAGRGLRAADEETGYEHYVLEVASVWRLDVPFERPEPAKKETD